MPHNRSRRRIIEVEGRSAFPIDMLRYDSAIPAREEDSHRIQRMLDKDEAYRSTRIRLVMTTGGEPTRQRWESFHWFVMKANLMSVHVPEEA